VRKKSRPRRRLLQLALVAAALLLPPRPGLGQAAPETAPLPFELAYTTNSFVWTEEAAISGDGAWAAYSVITPPRDKNLDARWQPNGTPSSAVGARVLAGPIDAGPDGARDVCPDDGNCYRPAWSPDGSSLAFYSDAGGSPQLWVWSRADGEARRVAGAPIKVKLWAGDEPIWQPDGSTVFVPLRPEGGNPGAPGTDAEDAAEAPTGGAGPTVTVFRAGAEAPEADTPDIGGAAMAAHYVRENNAHVGAVDIATGAVRIVVAADATPRPSVLRVSPSGQWVSYLSIFKRGGDTTQVSTHDLAVVPAAGGTVTTLAEDLPVLNADYHRLNYSWHPQRDALVYLKDSRLFLVEFTAAGPGAPTQLGADLGDLSPTPLWFTRDGKAVVVGVSPIDERDYEEPRPGGLAYLPLAGGAPRVLPIDDAFDIRAVLRADATTLWQPDGVSVSVLVQERATGESSVLRLHPDQEPRVLWQGLGRFEAFVAGGRHDMIVANYEDIGTAPDLYAFDADLTSRRRVSAIEPRLDALAPGTVEVFATDVPMYDGSMQSVRTAVLLPPGAKRGDRLPAVVLMYPGSDGSRSADRFGGGDRITVPTLTFTSRGYAVIYPNIALGPNGEAGNPAQEAVDVLLPQVYRAAELGYVDIERVGIAGQSFGGWGTAAFITRTHLFRAAVAISGIFDLPGTYGTIDEAGGAFWVGWSEGGQARMGTHPWAALPRYLENSAYYQADKIRTPLLIVHGDEDNAYPDAEKLFSALRRLDQTVQLAVYHGQGHVISSWTLPNATDAAARIVAFFDRHVKDAGSPEW
jgi:dipeptidyl aminopeptidase/acylaminoacyl peptidase